MAIKANSSAQSLCKDDHEGIKDLEQQHLKFITELAESKGIFTALMSRTHLFFFFYLLETANVPGSRDSPVDLKTRL